MSCPFIHDGQDNEAFFAERMMEQAAVEEIGDDDDIIKDLEEGQQWPKHVQLPAANGANNRRSHMKTTQYSGLNRSMMMGIQLEQASHTANNNHNSASSPSTPNNSNPVLGYKDYLRGQRLQAMSKRFSSARGGSSSRSLNLNDLYDHQDPYPHHHQHHPVDHHPHQVHRPHHHHHNNGGGHNHSETSDRHYHQHLPSPIAENEPTEPKNGGGVPLSNSFDDSEQSNAREFLETSNRERFHRSHHVEHMMELSQIIHGPETNPDTQEERMLVVREVLQRQKSMRFKHTHTPDEDAADEEKGGIEQGDTGDYLDHNENACDELNETEIPWYCPPVQRQRWGDDHVLPHINWGDIFFDLFYVAAAYNLGVLLISAMNTEDWPRGMVYFIGIFGPLYQTWECDVYYNSRFTVVDHFHRIFDVVRFLCVAAIVLHIKSFQLLSDSTSFETFALMLSVLLESLMELALHFEVLWYAQGDRQAIYNSTLRKIKFKFVPKSCMYLAATIISGIMVFRNSNSGNDSDNRLLAGEEVSSGDGWGVSDIPYLITMGTHFANLTVTASSKLRLSLKVGSQEDIRNNFVPHNIDYLIHRYGEWVMLMIGESVLSLLIVETVETKDYYIIALVGVLTVILIQTLKFESEPAHPEGHALLQSILSATSFTLLIEMLSMALIAFGVSFKVMLTIATTEAEAESLGPNGGCLEDDYDNSGRRILGADINCEEDGGHRLLGAVPAITDRAAATLYCVSLAMVLICLELMMISHHGGLKQAYGHLFKQVGPNQWKWNYSMVFLDLAKLTLILFIATMCKWQTDPRSIASAGFLVVAAFAFSRVLGWGVIHKEKEIRRFMSVLENKTKGVAKAVVDSSVAAASSLAKPKRKSMDLDALVASIWESSFDAIVVTDRMGAIKHINTTTLSMFGYDDSGELLGENIAILVGGGEAESHAVYLERFNESGKDSSTIGKQRVLYSRRKDSTEFPCIIGIKLVPDTEFLVGYIRNMTGIQNRHRETDLATDPVLRMVDDTSFDSIVVINKDGIIQHVNITTLSEFGYDFKDELIGCNVSVLVGGGYAGKHDGFVRRFDKKDKSDTILGKRRKLKSRRKDGSEFPCIIAINTIPESDCLIGVIRNLSGMSRRQKYIIADDLSAEGSQNAEDFLDDSFDSIVIANEDGTIIRVNRTTLETFRYDSKEELVGQNLSVLVGGGEHKKHDQYLNNFKKRGASESVIGKQRILRSRRKDGTEFPCVIGIKRMKNNRNLVGFIRDMSVVNQAENVVTIINMPPSQGLDHPDHHPYTHLHVDDTSFDSIVVINMEGIIQNVNLTTLSEFGYESKNELVNKNVSMLVGSDHADKHDEYLMRFKSKGCLSENTLGKQRPLHARRKDESKFLCLVGLKMIPNKDLVIGYIRNMTDFTEQQKAVEAG